MKLSTGASFAALAIAGALGAWAGWSVRPVPPPPLPQLARDTVVIEIETRESIEVEGEPPETATEHLDATTEPRVIEREVLVEVCTGPYESAEQERADPLARVRLAATKHEGERDGRWIGGWRGWAACEVSTDAGARWAELARSPFDYELSRAWATREPAPPPPRLPRFREVRALLGTDSVLSVGFAHAAEGRRWGWTVEYGRDFGETPRQDRLSAGTLIRF